MSANKKIGQHTGPHAPAARAKAFPARNSAIGGIRATVTPNGASALSKSPMLSKRIEASADGKMVDYANIRMIRRLMSFKGRD